MKPVDHVVIEFVCPFCGAEPGEWCRTVTGHRAAYLHELRFHKAVYAGALPLGDDLAPVIPLRLVDDDRPGGSAPDR